MRLYEKNIFNENSGEQKHDLSNQVMEERANGYAVDNLQGDELSYFYRITD